MKSLRFGRCALGICAATAMLGGCGGWQPSTVATTANAGAPSYPNHRTFLFTGSEKLFKVPRDVKWLKVIARGAGGNSKAAYGGGRGARVYAIIPVTPGETLSVYVGGAGIGERGGFNGGGSGGRNYSSDHLGHGGGGASDVRQDGSGLQDRILVAGGGGGEGGRNTLGYGVGGHGGASTGGTGGIGWPGKRQVSGSGGAGGAQDQGGAGGSGGESSSGSGYTDGESGSLGLGGDGGSGTFHDYWRAGGGGGGGGGYYGGGGGGDGTGSRKHWSGGGGGGGGGSSYIESNAKQFRTWQGWKNATGNGLIVFSWQ